MSDPAAAAHAAAATLDLMLHPDDAAVFWRSPALARWRQGRRVTSTPLVVIWHDTADRALAASGLVVAEQRLGARRGWRLEALHPGFVPATWPPGAAAPVLSDAPDAQGLALPLNAPLTPIARFEAVVRWLRFSDGQGLTSGRLATGVLHAGNTCRAVSRFGLDGAPAEAFAIAHALAGTLRLSVPCATLAAQAATLGGAATVPRHLGAPALPPSASVSESLALLIGQLADVLLHWAQLAGADAGPEPVHQMRVALRRLRSALKLFGRAAGCPRLDAAQEALRALAQTLGAARDWDVFLGGLGATIATEFADEPAIARMVRAAERRRGVCYAALASALDSPDFRTLGLTLAELAATRPWEAWIPADLAAAAERAALLDGSLADYARPALQRRLRHATRAGHDLAGRNAHELHALRIQSKRLRYACEVFAPAFPGRATRRFTRRLAAVQDRLGHLNDGAVAAGLMRQLGSGRGLAAGLVRGFVAARDAETRGRAERSWRRFRQCEPFWA